MKCKVSDKEIKPFISFGKMPMVNGFLDKNFQDYRWKMDISC